MARSRAQGAQHHSGTRRGSWHCPKGDPAPTPRAWDKGAEVTPTFLRNFRAPQSRSSSRHPSLYPTRRICSHPQPSLSRSSFVGGSAAATPSPTNLRAESKPTNTPGEFQCLGPQTIPPCRDASSPGLNLWAAAHQPGQPMSLAATQAGSSVPPARQQQQIPGSSSCFSNLRPHRAQHQSRATTHCCCGKSWRTLLSPAPPALLALVPAWCVHTASHSITRHPSVTSTSQYTPVHSSIPCSCHLARQHPPRSPSARGDFAARSLCLENPNCRRLRQEALGLQPVMKHEG